MCENLTLRAATDAEAQMIYGWVEKQFHPGEIKPMRMLEKLRAQGAYEFFGLWQGGALVAYALLGIAPDRRVWLLDYYAVLPEYQDHGFGSRFLKMLREQLPAEAIVFEVEDPDAVTEPGEHEVCRRRMCFYERNLCRHTPVSLNLFGYEYKIMLLKGEMDAASVQSGLETIYHLFCGGEIYRRNVRFHEWEV